MTSLRSSLRAIGLNEAPSLRMLARVLSLPESGLTVSAIIAALRRFRSAVRAPLVLAQHNMGLLPPPIDYLGNDRNAAIAALVNHLRSFTPDVVGLSECFVDSERAHIRAALADLYPTWIEGPDEDDVESDGGLLLLSRHPVESYSSTIYRECAAEDCLTNKGAVHIRIRVAEHPAPYDIVLSHTQNPEPKIGSWEAALEKLYLQLTHLSAFVHACGAPDRPLILLGDLNINGFDQTRYAALLRRLKSPDHVAPLDVPRTLGADAATLARDNTFYEHAEDRPDHDERLDYVFTWVEPHREHRPRFESSHVLVWSDQAGHNISDHFGIISTQSHVLALREPPPTPIRSVTVLLQTFRCLSVTRGSGIPFDDDEVQFELRVRTAGGDEQSAQTGVMEDVTPGTFKIFDDPLTLSTGDPGDWIELEVAGWEVDTIGGVIVGRTGLGRERLRLSRAHLLRFIGSATRLALPLLEGDSGQYCLAAALSVGRP